MKFCFQTHGSERTTVKMQRIRQQLSKSAATFFGCLAAFAFAQQAAPANPAGASAVISANPGNASQPAMSPASPSGQRLFDAARDKLVQIRILTRAGGSQASVGSGFLIAANGTALTNYHVISQLVLEPQRFRAEYVRVDGKRGEVALINFDVVHDLALIRLEGLTNAAHFSLRGAAEPLRQGEKIYSLGNPLDLGFAISEGTYNGLVERRLYEQIHFTGALNPGMSGGPALDEAGRVIGVNVAGTGGELANLLVPLTYVRPLVSDSRSTEPDKKLIASQLKMHQAVMVDALLAKPFKRQALGPAEVAVGDDSLLRCWGNSNAKPEKLYRSESTSCALRSSLFVDSNFTTGTVSWDHTYRVGEKLGAWRFAAWQQRVVSAQGKATDAVGAKPTRYLTRALCEDRFINAQGISYRAAVCVRAHREFEGLFDVTVRANSVDREVESLSSSLDAKGVSFANAQRLIRAFLEVSKWR